MTTAVAPKIRLQIIEKTSNKIVRDVDATGQDAEKLAAEIMRNMDLFRFESRIVAA